MKGVQLLPFYGSPQFPNMVIITIVIARFTNSFDGLNPRASISKGLLVKRYNIVHTVIGLSYIW
jgi:hypothetical protein